MKIKDKDASDWEREVREKRMLDIARSELKLSLYVSLPLPHFVFVASRARRDSYGNATYDEKTKTSVCVPCA